jgi:5'-phosphate synthase pdxT subunit
MSPTNRSYVSERVGVLALQGDFAKHLDSLRALGTEGFEVRSAADLSTVTRLIIPGGESTTVGLLMQKFGLASAIQEAAEKGLPIWGTCMGMIVMAREIEGRSGQFTLNLLDVKVARNAFGSQIHSFEAEVALEGLQTPVLGVFIRAPVVVECGSEVVALGRYQGQVVAVRQGRRLGTSFHPELTGDTRVHEYFLGL